MIFALDNVGNFTTYYVNFTTLPIVEMHGEVIGLDEQEREKRARKREEQQLKPNYEEMKRRLKADNIDFSEENLRKVGIGDKQTFENYDLDKCVESIVKYIQREREKGLTIREKYKVENLPPVNLKPKLEKREIEERGISD